MPHEERKPIYDAYRIVVNKLIERSKVKDYADVEIESLISELSTNFRLIKNDMIFQKDWENIKS